MRKLDRPFGQLVSFLIDPCFPSFNLLAEVSTKAAVKAFLSLAPLDKKSVLKIATGKSWLCHAKGIARGLIAVEPEEESLGLKFAFALNEFADEAIWYVYLADLAEGFVANWTSMLIKVLQCSTDPRVKRGSSTDVYGFPVSDLGWQSAGEFFGMYPDFEYGLGTGLTMEPGDEITMVFSGLLNKGGSGTNVPGQTGVRIIRTDTGQIYSAGTNDSLAATGKNAAMTWHTITNPYSVAIPIAAEVNPEYFSPGVIVHYLRAYYSVRWYRPGGW